MGRAPCCVKVGLKRGQWTTKEDALLTNYIQVNGEGHWRSLPKNAGLLRCGKSCRLRWLNYLRPGIKRGNISPDEDDLIIRMHALLGNKWSLIAGRLPGRTDNEIKNYWNTHLSKKLKKQGIKPNPQKKLSNPKSTNTKNVKKKSGENEESEPKKKLIAYKPKPIKVASLRSFSVSRNERFDWNYSFNGNASHEFGDGGLGILIGDCDNYDDEDFFHGSYLEYPSDQLSISDGDLDKLYDEYFQLLNREEERVDQFNSFDESFLNSLEKEEIIM